MNFTDAYSGSAVCSPTRYGLLTGRYSWRSSLKRFIVLPLGQSLIEPDRMTVGDLLRNQEYETTMIGKWHLGWDIKYKNGAPFQNGKVHPENADFVKQNAGEPLTGGPVDRGFDSDYGDGTINFPPYVFFENDRFVEKLTSRPDCADVKEQYSLFVGIRRRGPCAITLIAGKNRFGFARQHGSEWTNVDIFTVRPIT
jgi:arylsulfatase A-like enzyme